MSTTITYLHVLNRAAWASGAPLDRLSPVPVPALAVWRLQPRGEATSTTVLLAGVQHLTVTVLAPAVAGASQRVDSLFPAAFSRG